MIIMRERERERNFPITAHTGRFSASFFPFDDCMFHADTFMFVNALSQQSPDIAQGVDAAAADGKWPGNILCVVRLFFSMGKRTLLLLLFFMIQASCRLNAFVHGIVPNTFIHPVVYQVECIV